MDRLWIIIYKLFKKDDDDLNNIKVGTFVRDTYSGNQSIVNESEQLKKYRTSNYLVGFVCKYGSRIGAAFPVDRIFMMNHQQLLISDVHYCGLASIQVLTSNISQIDTNPFSVNVFFGDTNLSNYIGYICYINFKFEYI
jgi:hypothetical protein